MSRQLGRELPGLYWDDLTRRYYARSSSRPVPVVVPAVDPVPVPLPDHLTRLHACRAHPRLPFVLSTAHRNALIHQIQSTQIALTDTVDRSEVPSDAPLSAFQAVSHNGRLRAFAGNSLGCFYSLESDLGWQPTFYLSSEISSIAISGTTCVAATFGPECTILYAPLDRPVEAIHKIDNRVVHDVWTADLLASRLVLGANQQAVLFSDIALSRSLRRLPTQSDVFALAQRENIIYTGLRNGRILRFDSRIHCSDSHPLLSQSTGSVTALKHLRDHQLLASFIDGSISTFDLRFPIHTPLLSFTGNFNKYTIRSPLAIDPHQHFLFAAGQDNKIRLWSLLTGGPALDPGSAFQPSFQHPIAELQVVQESHGISLFAVSGTQLCKYNLGHR